MLYFNTKRDMEISCDQRFVFDERSKVPDTIHDVNVRYANRCEIAKHNNLKFERNFIYLNITSITLYQILLLEHMRALGFYKEDVVTSAEMRSESVYFSLQYSVLIWFHSLPVNITESLERILW